jgi:hypothetical protein
MRAGTHNFFCEQGSTFSRSIYIEQPDLATDPTGGTFTAFSLSGYTARMQVRRTIDAQDFLLNLSTENGAMTVASGVDENEINIDLAASVTASVSTSGVYDIEIINPSGNVSRVLQGAFNVSPEVTR